MMISRNAMRGDLSGVSCAVNRKQKSGRPAPHDAGRAEGALVPVTVMPMMVAPVAVMVVAVMPAAMAHHLGARDIVGSGIDAAAQAGRHRRGGPRRCERDRRSGQGHQQELAHVFSSNSPARKTSERQLR
jgi:hypothetical protein